MTGKQAFKINLLGNKLKNNNLLQFFLKLSKNCQESNY